jgi:hypothetical protein
MSTFRHAILNEQTLGGRYRAEPVTPLAIENILDQVKSTGPKSIEQFRNIFFYYRQASDTDLFCLKILSKAIKAGKLEAYTEFISIPPSIDMSLRSIGGERGRTVQSVEHQGMKLWIEEFLRSKGIRSAQEISQLGYRVDVGCLEKKLFIECGDTEPRKVFEFLRVNLSIGILQYDSENLVWFRPEETFKKYVASQTDGYFV